MDFMDVMSVLDGQEDAIGVMDGMLHQRLEVVRDRLAGTIGARLDDRQAEEVIAAFEELPPRYRARLLASAELTEIVQLPVGDAEDITPAIEGVTNAAWYHLVLDCIRRERLVSLVESGAQPGPPGPSAAPAWSPLGDRYAEYVDGSWLLRANATIGDVIALDFDSPLVRRVELRSGVLSAPATTITPAQRTAVARKLRAALSLVDQAVPLYGSLVRNFTRRVMIRRARAGDAAADRFSSEHVPRQPGAIRLLNCDAPSHTVAACAEQLLHESIHNFLACWETANRQIFPSGDSYRPVSPWSGNPIPNSSLSHAVFIYYACHRMFERFARRSDLSSEDAAYVARRGSVFVSGFLVREPMEHLFMSVKAPPAGFTAALRKVHGRIGARYGVAVREAA